MVLKQGSRCYISNRRHPCNGYFGKIGSKDNSDIALVVLREVGEFRIVINIRTNHLREDSGMYMRKKIRMYYDNSIIPQVLKDKGVRVERMHNAERESILSDYEVEEEDEPGRCSACGRFGPLGTYCVTSECEDSGNIYGATYVFFKSDSD